ncbi:MAG TPA: lamin tail domain-containing protein [Pseudonocardiaceae bacterium]|nr:lamin tail domain-containing protein [Pseudonocardiaceae bacterium]
MSVMSRATVAVAVLTTVVGAAAAAPSMAASPDVVLSEVYGGGGNSGAPYRNDFVELYNRGGSTVPLAGWSVQYASAAGTTWLVTALGGEIAPGTRYLIRLGSGGSSGAVLPAPDATGGTNLSATSGKVALVTSTAALGCGGNCDGAPGVRDFVGYGSANDYEGAPAPALSNTQSATRATPTADTDNNAADFVRAAPTPQNSAVGCGYPGTLIRAIQGGAHLSPLAGAAVSDVRGVVTAVSATGFWLQDPCPDGSVATSEAVFVYTSTAPGVTTGQEVAVSGRVSEFRPGGASSTNLTTTEITGPSVRVLGSRTLPAPVVVGSAGRVPPASVIDDDATGNVETSGSFDATTDGIDFYESLEGMRVRLDNPVAAGPRNGFGEIPVLADNGSGATVRSARGGIVLRQGDANPERVILDDAVLAGSTPAGVNTGDRFTAAAVGVMDYSFGNFKLQLTGALGRVNNGLAPETTSPPGAGQLAVATFNLENLDPGDPQSKFDGLARIVVTNLAVPGIIAAEEVQDNDGPANTTVVDAAQTWQKLIAAISAAGGPPYAYTQINPVDDADGGEPGGNIRVGLLYRTDLGLTLAPGTPGGPTAAVAATASGNPADPVNLSVNPGRINPTSSAFNASRKPLVAKFHFGGRPLFVIANHWNSKGGDDPLYGWRQPPQRSSEPQRGQQATQVAAFVDQIQAIDPQARIVVAGDLNDFEYSTAVQTLVAAGLTSLPATLPTAERYSYVFDGNSQFLDHIMLSAPLVAAGYQYDVVHVNAEFAVRLSDHDPQVARLVP